MDGLRPLAVDYDVYEIAYLAGGPCRAVDAAVVALVESGRVAVDRSTGHLSVVDERQNHWLEAAVLDAIGHRGYDTMETLRRRVADDDRFAAVRRGLAGDGLLRRSGSSSRQHRAWQTLALTGEGRRAVRHLRAEPPADRVAHGTGALPVALGGPAAMRDPSLRTALFDPPAPPRLPSRRSLRREAGHGLSTSAAATTFWVAGSESGAWAGDGGGWAGGGGWGDGGGGGGGDGGG